MNGEMERRGWDEVVDDWNWSWKIPNIAGVMNFDQSEPEQIASDV